MYLRLQCEYVHGIIITKMNLNILKNEFWIEPNHIIIQYRDRLYNTVVLLLNLGITTKLYTFIIFR